MVFKKTKWNRFKEISECISCYWKGEGVLLIIAEGVVLVERGRAPKWSAMALPWNNPYLKFILKSKLKSHILKSLCSLCSDWWVNLYLHFRRSCFDVPSSFGALRMKHTRSWDPYLRVRFIRHYQVILKRASLANHRLLDNIYLPRMS